MDGIMRPLIRIAPALYLVCLSTCSVWAGSGLPANKPISLVHFEGVRRTDSLLSRGMPWDRKAESSVDQVNVSTERICSCQILNLESNNYQQKNMVLLAERTGSGRSSDFRIARTRLQLEKKQMKKMFYDRVQVVARWESRGSCRSMYFRLRTADSHLQLFEILNAN